MTIRAVNISKTNGSFKLVLTTSHPKHSKKKYYPYGLKRGLGRRTEVGGRRRGTREDVVRRVNVVIIVYS